MAGTLAERMSVSDSRHLPPSSLLQIARDQVCCAEVINMLSAKKIIPNQRNLEQTRWGLAEKIIPNQRYLERCQSRWCMGSILRCPA